MTDEDIKKLITEQTSVFIRCLNQSFLQVLDKITQQDELLVQISRAVDNLEGSLLKNKIELKSAGIDEEVLMKPVKDFMDRNGIDYEEVRLR